jgi:hypothetical protein
MEALKQGVVWRGVAWRGVSAHLYLVLIEKGNTRCEQRLFGPATSRR